MYILLSSYIDQYNRQLRDVAFNKVIYYSNMACEYLFNKF